MSAAQWVLNSAMFANPIGIMVVSIVALIGLVYVVLDQWNSWTAALSLFLGPLGIIITLVQSFRRNWEMIVNSFKTGGIISGLLAIGKTILDAVLMPMQQVVALISKFTGFDWAASASAAIEKLRINLGTESGIDENGNPLTTKGVVNTQNIQHQAMLQKIEQTNNAKVGIDIKNKTFNDISTHGTKGVSINIGSTMSLAGGGGNW
jgi:hypothetical protein